MAVAQRRYDQHERDTRPGLVFKSLQSPMAQQPVASIRRPEK